MLSISRSWDKLSECRKLLTTTNSEYKTPIDNTLVILTQSTPSRIKRLQFQTNSTSHTLKSPSSSSVPLCSVRHISIYLREIRTIIYFHLCSFRPRASQNSSTSTRLPSPPSSNFSLSPTPISALHKQNSPGDSGHNSPMVLVITYVGNVGAFMRSQTCVYVQEKLRQTSKPQDMMT